MNAMFGAELFFKCENLQIHGAFKPRGAVNAVMQLSDDDVQRGVATHSSGNHAMALAYAARLRSTSCTIVMPHTTPDVKQQAVIAQGATVVLCEPTLAAREAALHDVVARTGAHVVHPSNDLRVIAGQGTAALELIEDVEDCSVIMAPVGGGGLMSGTAVAARALLPNVEIIGAEPAMADDAARSLQQGHIIPSADPMTIADGLRTSLGSNTFEILRAMSVRIVTAQEASIIEGLYRMMENVKLVLEPSATVTIGALLEQPELVRGKRVGVILCGGNIDIRRRMTF
jgi:threonine dehydratase